MNLDRKQLELVDLDKKGIENVYQQLGDEPLEELNKVASNYPIEIEEKVKETLEDFKSIQLFEEKLKEEIESGKVKTRANSKTPLKASLKAFVKRAVKTGILKEEKQQKETFFYATPFHVFSLETQGIETIQYKLSVSILELLRSSQYEYQVEHDPHLRKYEEIRAFQKENDSSFDWIVSNVASSKEEISKEEMEIIYPQFLKLKALKEQVDAVHTETHEKLKQLNNK